MQTISDLLKNKEFKNLGQPQKKIYDWSYYGDLACKALNLSSTGRGRLMCYFKNKKNAYDLHKLAISLSYSKRLPFKEEEKIRYFFGAVKRMY